MHHKFIGSASLPYSITTSSIDRLGRTNKDADALSQHPEPNCKLESESDTNSDDPVVLSYAIICNIIRPVLGDTKIPFTIRKEAQVASNSLKGESNGPMFHAVPDHTVQTSAATDHYGHSPNQGFHAGTDHSIHM